MYKLFSWIAVILWMGLIFYFSHQPASASNELSTGITASIIEMMEKVFPDTELSMEAFNHIVRKNAHFFVYLTLGLLLMNAVGKHVLGGYRRFGIVLAVCVLYAISDEVHQYFIPGRGAQVRDVLIDSAGALAGIGLYLTAGLIVRKARWI